MQAVVYSDARNHLRDLINRTIDDCETFIINTKDHQSAVLMSYQEYNAMKETLYLLSSKNNRERLLASIEQIEQKQFTERELLP